MTANDEDAAATGEVGPFTDGEVGRLLDAITHGWCPCGEYVSDPAGRRYATAESSGTLCTRCTDQIDRLSQSGSNARVSSQDTETR